MYNCIYLPKEIRFESVSEAVKVGQKWPTEVNTWLIVGKTKWQRNRIQSVC